MESRVARPLGPLAARPLGPLASSLPVPLATCLLGPLAARLLGPLAGRTLGPPGGNPLEPLQEFTLRMMVGTVKAARAAAQRKAADACEAGGRADVRQTLYADGAGPLAGGTAHVRVLC
jgi:hypothetical protein